jgi:hypothetical protein
VRALIALVCVFAASAAAHAAPTSIPAFTLSADLAPANTAIPEIVGLDYPNNGTSTVAQGTTLTLTAGAGQWTGSVITRAYNWHTVNAPTVSLGSGSTLTVDVSATPAVVGQAIELDETVNGLTGSTTQTSHWFGPIEPSAPVAPPAFETSNWTTNPAAAVLPVSPAHFLQQGHAIYPGCDIPPVSPNLDQAHVWYFDPIKGTTKDAGATGHAGSPFKDVSAIFNGGTGYTGGALFGIGKIIKPGDTIYIEPGDATHPIGDITETNGIYSTIDGTANGTVAWTWIMGDPAAATRPVLHRVLLQNGAAGYLFKSFNVEQYRANPPVSASGKDIVFEDIHVSGWLGHSEDPWFSSSYPNSGGLSDGTVVTASPVISARAAQDPPILTVTAPANSTTITTSSPAPLGYYVWSPGYFHNGSVTIAPSTGIPSGSKVIAVNGLVATIAPCDPVADAATGCPTTNYPGLSSNVPGCDPVFLAVRSSTKTGGCPVGTSPTWSGTTRALTGEKVTFTDQMKITPAGAWNSVDWDGGSVSGISFHGALDTAHSFDPTHPNLLVGATCMSVKDSIIRDVYDGLGMGNTTNTVLYNNKIKWASGDGIDEYSTHRNWVVHNYYSDPTEIWAHQDGIQYGDTNGRGESAATTDTFFNNAAIENEFYQFSDLTNYFPRTMQGINTTEHNHWGDYVADNIVVASTNGLGISGQYNVVVHNDILGKDVEVGNQPKGGGKGPLHALLANNIGDGVSRDARAEIPNLCDPVAGDLSTVETNLSIPFLPPGVGSNSQVYCPIGGGASSFGATLGKYIGLSTWTQTDFRSGMPGVSSLFVAYNPLLQPATNSSPGGGQGYTVPLANPCNENSFPDLGACSVGASGVINLRPNPTFAGTSVPIVATVKTAFNLPTGQPDGTYGVVTSDLPTGQGHHPAGVWKSCTAGCAGAVPDTPNWIFVTATFTPGIIGAGTNLGPQQPIADHAGKAWANPPSIGAYEAN